VPAAEQCRDISSTSFYSFHGLVYASDKAKEAVRDAVVSVETCSISRSLRQALRNPYLTSLMSSLFEDAVNKMLAEGVSAWECRSLSHVSSRGTTYSPLVPHKVPLFTGMQFCTPTERTIWNRSIILVSENKTLSTMARTCSASDGLLFPFLSKMKCADPKLRNRGSHNRCEEVLPHRQRSTMTATTAMNPSLLRRATFFLPRECKGTRQPELVARMIQAGSI
jgi:hypothetical protein